jgi:hypothetical protein
MTPCGGTTKRSSNRRAERKISLAQKTNWLCIPFMTRRVLWVGTWFVGFYLCLFAPSTGCAQDFARESFALNNSALFPGDATPTLWNRSLFSSPIALAWTMPEDPLPASNFEATKNVAVPASSERGLSERLWNALPKFEYATGEVGFLYGKSTGKYGGELKQAYIIGETGNDKTHIFVGASYEDSSFRFPRSGR